MTLEELNIKVEMIGERIEKTESMVENIHNMAINVAVLADNMKRFADELEAQGKRLDKLETLPSERSIKMQDSIFLSLITTIIGGIVGAISAIVFK